MMIIFSGLDCSGKSTQIELLKNSFTKRGDKNLVFWSRGGYTPGMQALKNLMRKYKSSKIPLKHGDSKQRNESFSNPIVRKIWLSLAILDLIFYYGIYLRFMSFFGVKVICDRYIFDTHIDFKLNFPQEDVKKWWLWRFLLFFAPKPKKHFVITIPVEESIRRSALKYEPFPDSEEVLELRLKDYLTFVSEQSFTIHIDGTKEIEGIHNFIIKGIGK
jgi:thymidylate kinase